MKRMIKASSGRTTSKDYIKVALFDYLADYDFLEIDGKGAEQVVQRIADLGPVFDVDDVLERANDEGCSIVDALRMLEDEYEEV